MGNLQQRREIHIRQSQTQRVVDTARGHAIDAKRVGVGSAQATLRGRADDEILDRDACRVIDNTRRVDVPRLVATCDVRGSDKHLDRASVAGLGHKGFQTEHCRIVLGGVGKAGRKAQIVVACATLNTQVGDVESFDIEVARRKAQSQRVVLVVGADFEPRSKHLVVLQVVGRGGEAELLAHGVEHKSQ